MTTGATARNTAPGVIRSADALRAQHALCSAFGLSGLRMTWISPARTRTARRPAAPARSRKATVTAAGATGSADRVKGMWTFVMRGP